MAEENEIKTLNNNNLNGNSNIERLYNEPPSLNRSDGNYLRNNNPPDDDDLGPLPPKWEKAYTESGEVYFIDHNTGTSHWLDPRLSKFQKKSLEDCGDDELPYGWEKICDPQYGIYYIDHVNRKTQYENPVLQAKRRVEMNKQHPEIEPNSSANETDNAINKMESIFTKNPAELCGERIQTTLIKSPRGLGFTIVGGDDDNLEEFLQIKSIVPNGPAWMDGNLRTGDILVYVNDICVLGFTHHEMVNIFQSILPGEEVNLDVCRGYPLPFDPNDPNTEVVTTIAVDGLNMGDPETEKNQLFLDISNDTYNFLDMSNDASKSMLETNPLAKIHAGALNKSNNSFEIPEIHTIIIVKGEMGFGFTIADSVHGQKVKKILDRKCCTNLMEGDILLSINSINIKNLTHNEVVTVLKECPKNQETILKVQRGLMRSNLSNKMGNLKGKSKTDNNNKLNNIVNGLYRSKTPTADIYSTQPKEILPIRPKTPLVDTRARIKTPVLLNEELNTDAIEMDSKLTEDMKSVSDSMNDNKSTISTATGNYDTTKMLTDHLDNLTINDQRSETYTTTDSISSNPKTHFFSPLNMKANNNVDYYGNMNAVYSTLPPRPPARPSQHLLQPSTSHFIKPINTQHQQQQQQQQQQSSVSSIPYQHEPNDGCFCYDCTDYRKKQQQFSSQNNNNNSNNNNNNNSEYNYLPYNLPPQMSDNVGKRLNDYLMDRKRSIGSNSNFTDYDLNLQNNNTNMRWNQPAYYPGTEMNGTKGYSYGNQDDFQLVEVCLMRQALGFGFRIVGGTEEGSQVTVGHIVPGGAADKDPRISTGDEILNINGVNVENTSHRRVVQLMGEAALNGTVTMVLRKRKIASFYQPQMPQYQMPITSQNANYMYPYNVVVTRHENEGFGFVIISSSNQQLCGSTIGKLIPGSPAERCGELKIGDRIIAVNGIDIAGMNHSDVVNLIKESGLQVQLTISNPIVNTSNGNDNGNNGNITNDNYYGNNSYNAYPLTS